MHYAISIYNTGYNTGVALYNSFIGSDDSQEIDKKINEITSIDKENTDGPSIEKLKESIDALCREGGYSEVNTHKDNYQIQLFFKTEAERKKIATALTKRFGEFDKKILKTNFEDEQYNKTNYHFSLKLSPNQTAALLGIDPKYKATLASAQKALKDLQIAKEDRLSQLPDDIWNRIILLSGLRLREIGRCTTLSKKFYELTNSEPLWRAIAELQNITLENGSHPKIQVEKFLPIENAVISLKPLDSDANITQSLAYHSEKAIAEKGGICLVPNQDKISPEDYYRGIVVIKEKIGEGEKRFLHLCAGGSGCFDATTINKLMPIAIAKLKELKIRPDYLATNIGRHLGNTIENFENWQKEQKKTKPHRLRCRY
jgi:hypothetical protein